MERFPSSTPGSWSGGPAAVEQPGLLWVLQLVGSSASEFAVGLCWPLGSSQCFPARERCAVLLPPFALFSCPDLQCFHSEAANKGEKGSFPLPRERGEICGLGAGKPWPCLSSGL